MVPCRPATAWAWLVLVAVLVLAAACTEAEGEGSGGSESSEALEVPDPPELEAPEGSPPAELVVEDLAEGDGPAVGDGTTLTVHYAAVTWSGAEVTSSYERGQPLTYEYGEGRWVEGWTRGIEGLREGGRRRIVVPPELGYGERGAPGIPPGETVVFVVDALDVG